MSKKGKKQFALSLKKKDSIVGSLFMIPFYLGFILFSIKPLFETFKMIFYDVRIQYGGYMTSYSGIDNLKHIFTEDPDFLYNLFSSVGNMLWQVPSILFISLFLAIIVNSKFFGRSFVRSVFFLPVIVITGTVILIIQNDVVANAVLNGGVVAGGKIEYNIGIEQLLVDSGVSSKIVSFFTTLANSMFNLLWRSGVQIVLFLAGLQSIPTSLYEASSVEGATKLDEFFKITLPMSIPIMLINAVYTIVDTFTDSGNAAMNQVLVAVQSLNFGNASAMAWSYFALIGVFIALVMLVFSLLNKKYT